MSEAEQDGRYRDAAAKCPTASLEQPHQDPRHRAEDEETKDHFLENRRFEAECEGSPDRLVQAIRKPRAQGRLSPSKHDERAYEDRADGRTCEE
jgi:hypothetical protein